MPRVLGEGPTIVVAPVQAATVLKTSTEGMTVRASTSDPEALRAMNRGSEYWWVYCLVGVAGLYLLLRERE